MAWPNNAMDVFKLLEKSNCRECGASTCLAFSASVLKGDKVIGDCPRLDPEIVAQYGGQKASQKTMEAEIEAIIQQMRQKLRTMDLSEAAHRVGGHYDKGKLTIKIMGKDFSVDDQGRLYSDIHVHGWLTYPFFDYVLHCQGVPLSNKWVPVRELENGKDWDTFFTHRCEKALKKVADTYPDFFEDMIHLFNGRQVENHYQSDISLVLQPLPKVPVLICYWRPDDGMPSGLNIFFDDTAEQNLPMESVYRLGIGLVVMFEKIAVRHGVR